MEICCCMRFFQRFSFLRAQFCFPQFCFFFLFHFILFVCQCFALMASGNGVGVKSSSHSIHQSNISQFFFFSLVSHSIVCWRKHKNNRKWFEIWKNKINLHINSHKQRVLYISFDLFAFLRNVSVYFSSFADTNEQNVKPTKERKNESERMNFCILRGKS